MHLPCTNSKVSAEQFRLSCCCKALHATNKQTDFSCSSSSDVPLFFDAALARMSSSCPKRALRFPKTPCKWRQQNAPSPLEENQPPIGLCREICDQLWGNQPRSLGTSPILRKSVTDFEEICHRLWENEPPTLGK